MMTGSIMDIVLKPFYNRPVCYESGPNIFPLS